MAINYRGKKSKATTQSGLEKMMKFWQGIMVLIARSRAGQNL